MQPIELQNRFLELLNTGTFIVQFATLVLLLTQFVKFVISGVYKLANGKNLPITGDAARYLTIGVQVLVWVLFSVAQAHGLEGRFTDVAPALEGILKSLAPMLPAVVGANFVASEGFKILSSRKTPGFKKPIPKAA